MLQLNYCDILYFTLEMLLKNVLYKYMLKI